MKTVFRIVLLAALAALGVWLWTMIFPSPQKIIRQRLEAVARHASFAPEEGTLARLASAQSLASYFSTNVEIYLDVPGRIQHTIMGRDEITQAALAARSTASSLSVKFLDVARDHCPEPAIRHRRSHRRSPHFRRSRPDRAGNEIHLAENQRPMAHYPRRNRPHAFPFWTLNARALLS